MLLSEIQRILFEQTDAGRTDSHEGWNSDVDWLIARNISNLSLRLVESEKYQCHALWMKINRFASRVHPERMSYDFYSFFKESWQKLQKKVSIVIAHTLLSQ